MLEIPKVCHRDEEEDSAGPLPGRGDTQQWASAGLGGTQIWLAYLSLGSSRLRWMRMRRIFKAVFELET